jgi:hypothetical protein
MPNFICYLAPLIGFILINKRREQHTTQNITLLPSPLFLVAYPVDDLQVRLYRAAAAGERHDVVDVQEAVLRAEGLPAERTRGLDSPRRLHGRVEPAGRPQDMQPEKGGWVKE